jgi:tetratricopeptide (TPR) repeat protein
MRRILIKSILAAMLLGTACRHRIVPATATAPTPNALYKSGLAAFHEGTPEGYERAAATFRQASQRDPSKCEYALNLAQSLLFLATEQILNWEEFEPRQKEAASVVNSVATQCMANQEPFLLRVRALVAGRGPTAAELINRAVDLDPDDAMNWLVLGYLDPASSRLTTTEGAGRWVAMSHALALKPDSALIQYETGKNYQLVPHREMEARQAFERAIELSPRHFRAYLALAYSADENTDVEPLYKRMVEIAPNFLEGRIAAGSYYAAIEEIDKSKEQYLAAASVNPRYDIAYFRLGQLMLQADRPDDAEASFRKVEELNTVNAEARYYLGNILYGRKQYDAARLQYEEALKRRINYAEAEYGIGWVFRQKDQNDLAVTEFDKVIAMQPRYGDAYLSRGDIRAERRHFDEALTDYDKAIAAYEDQIKVFDATIATAESRSQSRMMQAEKRRAERDKARVEAILKQAHESKSHIQDQLKN